MTVVPESDDLARRGEFFMTHDEINYIKRLVEKHADNYQKMARDMKLNPKQHTLNHLTRRCERYHSLMAQKKAEE